MELWETILILYFFVINIVGFFLMRADKLKAVRRQWRIPELTLMLVAVFGGSVGVFFGMTAFRHKTKTLKFTIGVPVILGVQVIVLLFVKYPGFAKVFGF